jgi:hypothetical protein
VQLEQEHAPIPLKPVDDSEFQGFIGKYTRKVEKREEPQQYTVIEESEPTPQKKGMAERFEEKVAQDA